MCTVTIAILPGRDRAIRIACNRDESLSRPVALAPRKMQFEDRQAILPIDPLSNGTWIAVNDAGLALILLNRNFAATCRALPPRSRGNIIPSLLHVADPIEATALAATALHPGDYAPFRLLAVDRHSIAELSSDGVDFDFSRADLDEPLLFTSSALGDHLVDPPRRKLFRTFCDPDGELPAHLQDEFHRHRWPSARHLSVCMSRPDARTVSFTAIELHEDRAAMTYLPLGLLSPETAARKTLYLHRTVTV